MKKLLFVLFVILIPCSLFSQVVYSHKVDSIINLVSSSNLSKYVRELSGDTVISINSIPSRIYSRLAYSPSNQLAAQYILEKFQSFGLSARFQYNNSSNINIIAKKTGYLYPNRKVLITAHYDNYRDGAGPLDTVKGADDNASGVAAVLECARLLANYNPKYTIEFIAFDEEELGLYGAYGYADSCAHDTNNTVVAVFNMDMIGYDGNNDNYANIFTKTQFDYLADMMIGTYQIYNIPLISQKAFNSGGSDHAAFWSYGIPAITSIEFGNDFNPAYHTLGDVFGLFNIPYFKNQTKANLATLLSMADMLFCRINHTPLQSGFSNGDKTADAEIIFGAPLAGGTNAPRLYYKIGAGSYQFVNAYEIVNGHFMFRIPGQPAGTQISYYIAAQDSSSTYLVSYPAGASGFNPPGYIPPPQVLTYFVYSGSSFVSNKQKPIQDNQFTLDTIYIPFTGSVQDVRMNLNLNHSNDGDLLISLVKGNVTINLSQFNGNNGQNYTNTTFCDTAAISITAGTPPFTGWFKPQQALTGLKNVQIQGNWVLRIYDLRAGNTGTLLNWTLNLAYSSPISIRKTENTIPDKFCLFQNFPNPFNPATKIKFSLPENVFARLTVYDILGREIRQLIGKNMEAGEYEASFDAGNITGGVYFIRLEAGNYSDTKKMLLLK